MYVEKEAVLMGSTQQTWYGCPHRFGTPLQLRQRVYLLNPLYRFGSAPEVRTWHFLLRIRRRRDRS